MSSIRVLIVTEHASGQCAGEPLLPFYFFQFLRQRKIEAWMVVHERSAPELRKAFAGDLDRLHFVSDTWLQVILWKCGLVLPDRVRQFSTTYLIHLLSQRRQRRVVRRLVRAHGIDLVHEPTPVAPRLPSMMHGLGAPVVMGPMNGGMDYPPAFEHFEAWWSRAYVRVGRYFSDIFNRLIPGKRRAASLVVANARTRQALPAGVQGRVYELVENGVDLTVWRPVQRTRRAAERPVQFVFLGRLVGFKGTDMLVEAFAQASKQIDARLEIIGEGYMRPKLEALIREHQLENRVTLAGWLDRPVAAAKLRASDVLVLPSVLEAGGAVVLEAMAMGMPVIAAKWGGPVDYLDDTCGILIEPHSRAQLVHEVAAAMVRLGRDPDLCLAMGRAGQQRIAGQYSWQGKIDRLMEIYEDTLARTKSSVPCSVPQVPCHEEAVGDLKQA